MRFTRVSDAMPTPSSRHRLALVKNTFKDFETKEKTVTTDVFPATYDGRYWNIIDSGGSYDVRGNIDFCPDGTSTEVIAWSEIPGADEVEY